MPGPREDAVDDPSSHGRRLAVLGMIIGLIVAATLALVWLEVDRQHEAERGRDSVALDRSLASLRAIQDVLSATGTAQALVGADGGVEPGRFQAFASALLRQSGVSSVAYEPRIRADQRDSFEAQTGIAITEWDDNGDLVAASTRSEHFPITLYAPETLSGAEGFDVSSDPSRREALIAASARRVPVATPPVPPLTPVTEIGMLVFVPLFQPTPLDQAPGVLVGFVSVAYFTEQLASDVQTQLPRGAALTIADGDELLISTGDPDGVGASATVNVLGRDWTVQVRHPDRASMRAPWALGIGGTLFAVLVAGVGGYLIVQHRRLVTAWARTGRLQAATADLARCELPESVRSCATRHSTQMLAGRGAGYVIAGEDGVLDAVTVTDDRTREHLAEVPTASIEENAPSRHPLAPGAGDGRRGEIIVLPVPGAPRLASAIAVVISDGASLDRADIDLCASFAVVVGAAMRRAETYQLEHRMAEMLQRQLLAPHPPEIPGMTVAASYRPAHLEAGVGGDWYDIIALDTEQIAVTVGDVVGHGILAAGVMGQLRIAIRSLAGLLDPAAILEHLDQLAADIPGADCASAVYLHMDLARLTLSYSVAGHPPPILVRDGEARLLWNGRGPLIGVHTGKKRHHAVLRLQPGDRIITYTDGLIERRDTSFDDSLDNLWAAALATRHLASQDACDDLLRQLTGLETTDDVAITVITLDADHEQE